MYDTMFEKWISMDNLGQNLDTNTVLLALVHHDDDMRPVILFTVPAPVILFAVPAPVILFVVLAPVIFRGVTRAWYIHEGTHACYILRGNSPWYISRDNLCLLYFMRELTLVIFHGETYAHCFRFCLMVSNSIFLNYGFQILKEWHLRFRSYFILLHLSMWHK